MTVLSWCALAVIAVLVLLPLAWAVSTSLKPEKEILAATATLIPRSQTLDHYGKLLRDGYQAALWNSTLVTFAAILIALVMGSIGGYILSRYAFRGHRVVLFLMLATMAVPIVNLLVPLQALLAMAGLLDSLVVLAFLYAILVAPLAVWIMKAHFDAVPIQIEQAAWIDGYSRASTVRRIVVPGTRPALLAVVVITFLASWNDYVLAATMTSSPGNRTALVALVFYEGTYGREWGPLMAGVTLAALPPVLVFLLLRRNLVRGVASGALKG
jgi:ABC-type glycerol-3-phosphate transport system permease component